MKKCINITHSFRRELVSQIVEVESVRIVLDSAQAEVIRKLMRDPSYMNDLWKDNRSGRCMKDKRIYNNFNKAYFPNDRYVSVLTAIIGKAGRLSKKESKKISWRGNYTKHEVPEIDLNYLAISLKSK